MSDSVLLRTPNDFSTKSLKSNVTAIVNQWVLIWFSVSNLIMIHKLFTVVKNRMACRSFEVTIWLADSIYWFYQCFLPFFSLLLSSRWYDIPSLVSCSSFFVSHFPCITIHNYKALSYRNCVITPGWWLMRAGYHTCFHTLYDENYNNELVTYQPSLDKCPPYPLSRMPRVMAVTLMSQ